MQESLSLSLSPDDPRERFQVRFWWLEASGSAAVRLDGTGALATVPPDALESGGSVTIGAEFVRVDGDLAANATIEVRLNGKPACRLAACAAVENPVNADGASRRRLAQAGAPSRPFGTPFELSAAGFSDPEGEDLSYSFGVFVSGAMVTRRSGSAAPSAALSGLGVGSHALFACATDASGAASCDAVEVAVTAPAVAIRAEEAVDIAQLAAANVRASARSTLALPRAVFTAATNPPPTPTPQTNKKTLRRTPRRWPTAPPCWRPSPARMGRRTMRRGSRRRASRWASLA